MKVVVCSDSHGHWRNLQKVIDDNRDADYILHLGDLCEDKENYPELTVIRGNNDYDWDLPLQIIADYNGLRVLAMHSHTIYSYKRVDELAKLAKKNKCQIAFYGHTHVPDDRMVNGVRVMNPGSLMYNRDGSPVGYFILTIEDKDHYQVVFEQL